MIGLTILIAILTAERATKSKIGLIWLLVAAFIALLTFNPLLGLLYLVVHHGVLAPYDNLRLGRKFFESDHGTWKGVFSGEYTLYDVVDGRIALMIESFIFIVLLFES